MAASPGESADPILTTESSPKTKESWRNICSSKWNLILEDNDCTTDEEWQSYFDERLALEERHKSFEKATLKRAGEVDDSDEYEDEFCTSQHPLLRDFQFCEFCFDAFAFDCDLDNVLNHLKIMREGVNGFGMSDLGSHLYTLKLYMGEDDSRNPRDIDLRSRLYSPFSSHSLDFKFTYHYRARLYETEDYHYLQVGLRNAQDIMPDPKAVFAALPKDSGKWLTFLDADCEEGHRMASPVKLRKIQRHIFGRGSTMDGCEDFPHSLKDMCKIILISSGIELLQVLRTYYSGCNHSIEPDNIGWIWKYVEHNFKGE